MKIEELINQAEQLAIRDHYYVEEDCWYSCGAHPECCNDQRIGKCDCGAEEHNKRVKEVFGEIRNIIETIN